MSIHQRTSNKTWYVAYRTPKGKQTTKNFGKGREGKRDAQKFDKNFKEQKVVLAAAPVSIAEEVAATGKIYLDQLLQLYINARKIEGTTIRTLIEIKKILELHLIPVFAQRPVEDIRCAEILDIIGLAYAHRSPVTLNKYLSYIKTVFKFGVDHDLIPKNPLRQWHKPAEHPRNTRLTVADLLKIKEAAVPHLAWAIEVAYHLGVRTGPSELLALKWGDINWEQQTISVFATKTKTRRTIPISDEFLARLRVKKELTTCERVVDFNGRPVSQISRAMRTAIRKAGIKYPVVLYDIRHLFATTLLNSGGELSAVSKLMGHAQIQTTVNNYYHLLENEKRRTIEKLPPLI